MGERGCRLYYRKNELEQYECARRVMKESDESDEGGEVERKGGEREIRRVWKRITEGDDDPQCEGWS